jgi:hypothetical protein
VKRRAAIVKAVRNAARSSGARIVRLEVHRPYGVALALSLAADDPATFLKFAPAPRNGISRPAASSSPIER